MKYLKPTPELIAEMGSRLREDDRRCLDLPDGDRNAVRLTRLDRKFDKGSLGLIAPWATVDFFFV